MKSSFERDAAFALACLVPAALLGGAVFSQFAFGLVPCEMCWWQRYPHMAALVLAALGWMARKGRGGDAFIALAAISLGISGLIGAFHAGVEYHWWQGITACTQTTKLGNDPLAAISAAPLVRCDVAPWSLFGISLAGYNFLISTSCAALILGLLRRARRGK
ncbi:MAG: disulfide bond formation protein B [Sphingomonadales bacterium]|nr:disulfide bond formation protein B [Sphingomonadales bacterium]MDE2568331.1 disulfide bond formation protein B [Sphingomonadales bacterium]